VIESSESIWRCSGFRWEVVLDTTTGPIEWIEESGFVVLVRLGKWLKCVDGPLYADEEGKATKWPTQRSAQRALSRLRRRLSKTIGSAKIYEVKNERESGDTTTNGM